MMSEAGSQKTDVRRYVLYLATAFNNVGRASASFSGRKGKGEGLISQFVTKEIIRNIPAGPGCG